VRVRVGTSSSPARTRLARPCPSRSRCRFTPQSISVRGIKPWSCSAVVLRDPASGESLGVLDVSGLSDRFHRNWLALAMMAAGRIEADLAARHMESRWRLVEAGLQGLFESLFARGAAIRRARAPREGGGHHQPFAGGRRRMRRVDGGTPHRSLRFRIGPTLTPRCPIGCGPSGCSR